MRQTITKLKGLTVNVEVIEVEHRDQNGGLLCYLASIYVQRHGSAEKQLIRRSRLPGAAVEMRKAIQRDGIRAINRIAVL